VKCPLCQKCELRWVKGGKRFVYCAECGHQMPNYDGKIKIVGRPPKPVDDAKQEGTEPK